MSRRGGNASLRTPPRQLCRSRSFRPPKQLTRRQSIALDDVSTTSTAWEAYITSQGVPVVGGNVSEAPFSTNPDFFADGSSLPVNLVGDMLQMQKLGLKHFGMMYCAEAPVCATQGTLASDAAKAVPGITVSSEKVAATSPTYTAQCVAFKSAGVDALFTGVPAQEGLRVIDSCKTLGYTPKPTVQVTVTGHNWLSDPNVNGTIIIAPNANFADSSVPGVKAFQDAMQNITRATSPSHNTAVPRLSRGSRVNCSRRPPRQPASDRTPPERT
jgi:branched-chain amino acid transport system substrate-binding protein